MRFLASLNLTWQAVVALGMLLGFGAWVAYLHPAAIPALLGMLGGGGLALQAPPLGKQEETKTEEGGGK